MNFIIGPIVNQCIVSPCLKENTSIVFKILYIVKFSEGRIDNTNYKFKRINV